MTRREVTAKGWPALVGGFVAVFVILTAAALVVLVCVWAVRTAAGALL